MNLMDRLWRGAKTLGRATQATAYKAASLSPRLSRWPISFGGPNAQLSASGATLRARSRDAVRDDGIAAGAIDTLVSNVVGTGIKPQFVTTDPEFNRRLADAFLTWTDESDADGRLDFYGQQALAFRSMAEGGDVFVRMRVRRPEDGLSVPLQVQILESEFCPDDLNRSNGANTIRAGIEFGTFGRRLAYHMFQQHPFDGNGGQFVSLATVPVPASEIAHMSLVRRPGMIRGEPWLTRALVNLQDFSKYNSAQLVRQQIAALFAGFVTQKVDAVGDETQLFGEASAVGTDGVVVAPLEPGTMQVLDPNQSVEWSKPPEPGDSYEAFMRQQFRAIAVAAGLLYEQASGDYSQINDRTFRASVNEFRRKVAMWQHHVVVFQFCRPVLQRWVDLAILSGAIQLPTGITAAMVARAKWVPQGFAYINPVQDVQARKEEVRSGFRSRSEVVSETGLDAETVDAEQSADNARTDGAGLIYDIDPRKVSVSGVGQKADAAEVTADEGI